MKSKAIIFLLALSLLIPVMAIKAVSTNNLKGKILLQVESHGEAWYVNPADGQRYYMADGNAAFNIMRNLSLGMSNKDVERMKSDTTYRQKFVGKILLQVESHGEAYYIGSDGRYNYLKDGAAAYEIMSKSGLGISNTNLEKIAPSEIINTPQPKVQDLATTTEIKKELPKLQDLATTTEVNEIAPTEINKEPETPIQSKPVIPAQPEPEPQIETPIQPQSDVQTSTKSTTPTSTSTAITTIITNPDPFPGASTTHEPMANFVLTNKSSCRYDENFKCYSDSLCSNYKDKDVRGRCFLLAYNNFGYQKKCSDLNNEYPNFNCALTSSLTGPVDRDTQTLYDIKKLQILLKLYHDFNLYRPTYPQNPYLLVRLFTIEKIPIATKGISSICSEDYNYKYTFFDSENYSLTYCLDSDAGDIKAGINVVTNKSLQ
jgi:hypothetical protein